MSLHLLDFNGGVTNRGAAALQALAGVSERWPVREDGALPPARGGTWILSGGPGSPLEDGPWRAPLLEALRNRVAEGAPTLAICYGFELLAHGLGATVRRLRTRRVGVVPLVLTAAGRQDPLLGPLAGAATFENREWGVFGPMRGVLAYGEEGEVVAARLGPAAVGVLFHPEADPEGARGALASAGAPVDGVERLDRVYRSLISGFLREASSRAPRTPPFPAAGSRS